MTQGVPSSQVRYALTAVVLGVAEVGVGFIFMMHFAGLAVGATLAQVGGPVAACALAGLLLCLLGGATHSRTLFVGPALVASSVWGMAVGCLCDVLIWHRQSRGFFEWGVVGTALFGIALLGSVVGRQLHGRLYHS